MPLYNSNLAYTLCSYLAIYKYNLHGYIINRLRTFIQNTLLFWHKCYELETCGRPNSSSTTPSCSNKIHINDKLNTNKNLHSHLFVHLWSVVRYLVGQGLLLSLNMKCLHQVACHLLKHPVLQIQQKGTNTVALSTLMTHLVIIVITTLPQRQPVAQLQICKHNSKRKVEV